MPATIRLSAIPLPFAASAFAPGTARRASSSSAAVTGPTLQGRAHVEASERLGDRIVSGTSHV